MNVRTSLRAIPAGLLIAGLTACSAAGQVGAGHGKTGLSSTSPALQRTVPVNAISALSPSPGKPTTGETGPTGQTGAAGAPGARGPQGPAGTSVLNGTSAPTASGDVGQDGDFYLDTTTDVLYGPEVLTCHRPQPCTASWGPGTSLVGQAPSQLTQTSGPAYFPVELDTDAPQTVSKTVLLQNTTTGGDYSVVATVDVVATNTAIADWSCALNASNGGTSMITLDTAEAVLPAPPVRTGATAVETELTLIGDVSLAGTGRLWIRCSGPSGSVAQSAKILSTRLTNFTVS